MGVLGGVSLTRGTCITKCVSGKFSWGFEPAESHQGLKSKRRGFSSYL